MPDAFAVKYIHSAMRGAPVLNGIAGSLIAVLDALLLNGWGSATAASVTVASGVATATFSSDTVWEAGAVIEVSGATPGALNGPARVLSAISNAITFPTSAPDGAATGTIAIKYAAAGWQKAFTGANMAAYRSQDVQSAKHYLRVRDSYGKYATVAGYESMNAISTGTGRFARHATLDSNQSVWEKSLNADSAAVPYLIASDGRAVLVSIACGVPASETYQAANVRGFGDPLVLNPAGDVWATFLSAAAYDSTGTCDGALSGGGAGSYGSVSCPRGMAGTGGAQALFVSPVAGVSGVMSGEDLTMGPVPSAVNGALLLSRIRLSLADGASRAYVPGLYYIPQSGASAVLTGGGVYMGAGELAGRRLRAVVTASNAYSSSGRALMDLTGPWRGA